MSVEDQENDSSGTSWLSEVAQVHKRWFREKGKVGIAQPDEEAGVLRLEDAWVLAERLRAA